MSRLVLSFFGAFRVTLDGVSVSGFKSNKVRALLAYLSVESARPHSRQSLAGLLWPELSDQAAAAALRNALSNLRHLLPDSPCGDSPPFLLITREMVQFNPGSDYWLDVEAFDDLLSTVNGADCDRGIWAEPAQSRPQNQGSSLNALQSAVALYQGDFLAGFFIAGSIPFEEWSLLRTEEYHSRVIIALQQLSQLLIEQGDYDQAQRFSRQQIELEPYSEIAYRQLMSSLASAGLRGEALHQYTNLQRLLADELSTVPEPGTTRLYETIRSGLAVQEWPGKPEPALQTSAPTPSPFVARESQLAQLGNYLAEAMSQQGRVAFVIGEPGSGKTALLDEFSRCAMQRYPYLIALSGSCTARGGFGSPYLPFIDILGMLSGDIESHRAGGAITPEHARRLWELWPTAIQALVEHSPGLVGLLLPAAPLRSRVEAFAPHRASWRADLERLVQQPTSTSFSQPNIFEQVTAVLRELARHVTLLLVIDDLQWADASSLGLLFHLGQRLAGSPILILGAYRPAEVKLPTSRKDDRLSLPGIVNELQRSFGDLLIDLDQADGQAFVEAFLDAEPNQLGKDFRQTLYQHTGGNPLFTVELLRSMQEREQIVLNSEGQRVAVPSLDWGELPPRVEGVIGERIRRLPDDYRRLLEAASVEGEIFTAEVAARFANVTDEKARRQLFTAIARHTRLVRAESIQRIGTRRLSRFRFRHILYQKYIYRHLDPVERRGLHQTVGEALEAFFAESEFQKLGLSSEGISRQSQLAWHFEQAGLPERAVEYLIQAGNQAVQLSANTEAVSLYMHALSLIKTLPESQERTQKELELQINLSVPLVGLFGWGAPERTRAYNRVIELSRQINNSLSKAQVFRTLLALALHHFSRGEFQQAAALGEQLLGLSQQIQDPADEVMAHCIVGQTYVYLGKLRSACEHLEHALALYEGDLLRPWMAISGFEPGIMMRGFLAVAWWTLGYPERAWQSGQAMLLQAQTLGHPMSLNFAAVHIITSLTFLIHSSLKGFHWSEKLTQPVVEDQFRADSDLAFFRLYASALQGFVQVEQGDVEEGMEGMRSSIAELRLIGTQIGRPILLYLLAIAHLKADLFEQGLAIVEDILSLLEKSGSHLFTAGFYRLKGEILLSRLQAMVGGRHSEVGAQLSIQEAEVYEKAESCFLKAIEVARRQEAKSWELRATISLARLWQRQGKVEPAQRVLEEIYGWFSEGFDTPDLVLAREVLEELAAAKPCKELMKPQCN